MIAVLQRVRAASVEIGGEQIAQIGRGALVLLGVRAGDTERDARTLAGKCVGLRIFEDERGKMNRALKEVGGALLIVPNFTLCADTRRGRRPGFEQAARPEQAIPLYELFARVCAETAPVQMGVFGADMLVRIENAGPVTILIDSARNGG